MTGQEFNAILLSLLGIAALVGAILFWRMFTRMEKKIDDWFSLHLGCRERQFKEFTNKKEFDEWKKGRDLLWRRINRHAHDKDGKVVITESPEGV
ncbi:MAG: LPXTG cell wall anchor domain-containing protein [Thermodesulfobacteriota bacterium]|nr:LPXTG cell wall anchor domain-containing protein [Thermodesulfobacteriota bacterium]